MKRFKTEILILLTILLALSTHSAFAESRDTRSFTATVRVVLTADENIKNQVQSYINRELRALHDVTIVDEGADWNLQIVAMEATLKNEYNAGVVIYVVIIHNFDNQLISGMFQEKHRVTGTLLTNGLASIPDQWLRIGSADQLQSMCIRLVADFDNKYLEENRKSHRNLMKILERGKP